MDELRNPAILEQLLRLKNFFYVGRFNEGLDELTHFFDYKNPNFDSIKIHAKKYDPHTFADFLYYTGILYGFHSSYLESGQLIAKDLLTKAFDIYSQLNLNEWVATTANHLAICYQRMGATDEANIWLNQAFESNTEINKIYLESLIAQSLIYFSESNFEKSLASLNANEDHFMDSEDLYFIANYFNHRGLAKRNLSNPECTDDYLEAMIWFKRIGHYRFLSTTENNLAWYYISREDYDYGRANHYANESFLNAEKYKDTRMQGCVLDTLAHIEIRNGDLEKALSYADNSINTLASTEAFEYLIESYETKIMILAKFGESKDVLDTFQTAYEIAKTQTSESVQQRLVNSYNQAIRDN